MAGSGEAIDVSAFENTTPCPTTSPEILNTCVMKFEFKGVPNEAEVEADCEPKPAKSNGDWLVALDCKVIVGAARLLSFNVAVYPDEKANGSEGNVNLFWVTVIV